MNKFSVLGKNVAAPKEVNASVLNFINRERKAQDFKFFGQDTWNCYELSWLNKNGIPQAGICKITYDYNSVNIVESKSLKLYLAGFYNTSFSEIADIDIRIFEALDSKLCNGKLNVKIFKIEETLPYLVNDRKLKDAFCLDNLEEFKPELSLTKSNIIEEKLYTNNFRSICPVTSQPDWATIAIHYKGKEVEKASLLGYLMGFREHPGFHEEVIEKIYSDLFGLIQPEFLQVSSNFLRRGGIDINPVRYSEGYNFKNEFERLIRQ